MSRGSLALVASLFLFAGWIQIATAFVRCGTFSTTSLACRVPRSAPFAARSGLFRMMATTDGDELKNTSYYKTIKGVKYDRSALDAAQEAVAGRGDGRVSLEDARAIAAELKDGAGVTKIEYRTAFKILDEFKFTEEARKAFITDMANTN